MVYQNEHFFQAVYTSTISVYWFNKTVVNLNKNVSFLSQNNTLKFQECFTLEPTWMMNVKYLQDSKLIKLLFDPPHTATVCGFVGTHILSTQNLLPLNTVTETEDECLVQSMTAIKHPVHSSSVVHLVQHLHCSSLSCGRSL